MVITKDQLQELKFLVFNLEQDTKAKLNQDDIDDLWQKLAEVITAISTQ